MTTATGEAGTVMLSRDGRRAYRIDHDGAWHRLPGAVAAKLIEERKAKDYLQSERERVLRERNERDNQRGAAGRILAADGRSPAAVPQLERKVGEAVRAGHEPALASGVKSDGVPAADTSAGPPPLVPLAMVDPVTAVSIEPAHPATVTLVRMGAAVVVPFESEEEPMVFVNPRDVTVTYGPRKEGEPATVRLTHRPSGRSFEGQGKDYGAARADAQKQIEAGLAGLEESPA